MTTLASGCKINLGLKIQRRLDNGYHQITSVFLPLATPSDKIVIQKSQAGLHIDCAAPIAAENNILKRLWDLFGQQTGIFPALAISLAKHVPIGAGLGGGSANAGALLKWLGAQFHIPEQILAAIAVKVGADVPFFLDPAPALVSGIGEKILTLPTLGFQFIALLVWPGFSINTAWAYKAYDSWPKPSQSAHPPFYENLLTKLCSGAKQSSLSREAKEQFFSCLENDLEPPLFAHFPELDALKTLILEMGAFYAAMSGSGSAIFGLFNCPQAAASAYEALRARYSNVYLSGIIGM